MFKLDIRAWWDPKGAAEQALARRRRRLREAAELLVERARLYCPVDTGELKASIQAIGEAGGLVWHVLVSAEHGEPVEFGHLMPDGRFHPPNPFFRRAFHDVAALYPDLTRDARVRQGYHAGRLMGVTLR